MPFSLMLFFGRGAACSAGAVFHGGVSEGGLQGRARLFERVAGRRSVNSLTRKARGVDFDIAGQYDDVGGGDVVVGELVLRAHRALGFDADLVAHGLARFGERFGGHKGVRNPGGAGGDGNDVFTPPHC